VKSSILFTLLPLAASFAQPLPKEDGYRGIWYYNQSSKDQYRYKYSGGFATYPQQHAPIAIYSKTAGKTFFVYGGTVKGKQELLHMVSYYDHKTGMVPRPVILMNKQTDDAHDNPTLSIDSEGYLWIFGSAHGTTRPAYIHRSRKPYSIDDFERISETNFSYPQPWYIAGEGFLFLHTRYRDGGRSLFWMRSADGRQWTEPELLSRFEMGHYQISLPNGKSVGTAFNYHPKPLGLNERTNIYYLATSDMGTTWKTAAGTPVKLPLQDARNPALVHDYKAEKLLVYMKDMQYDSAGRPVLFYLTSKGFESGPKNDPRMLHTARWDGKNWIMRPVTATDHNYDYGSLYIESDGLWRIIATTAPGPQAYGTGGEVVMWQSRDQGKTWTSKQLTNGSTLNQNYPRRPLNAHPDFYALWADGNAFQPSESSLYFTDRNGGAVWKLPSVMKADFEKPQRVR
jgi:hypothetical protein